MPQPAPDPADRPEMEDERELLEAVVPLEHAGRRFDQALAELFPDFSRSRLTAWIKSGEALLDGAEVKPRQMLRGGETITLWVTPSLETRAEPEPIPLDLRHADEEVLVLNKPAGLVVHPGAGNPRGTLVNALLHFDPKLAELPRAGIVHRLDKDTSGLMVVARSLRAHAALVEQLSSRHVHRQYLAVVAGSMVAGGTVDAPIGRHPGDRIRQAVNENGREAVTHYRVRERFRSHTLVECRLETGRTHQIRVHMAHIRHPLVGDPLYGGALRLPRAATPALAEALRGFRRQALHAETLGFTHPATGEALRFQAEAPEDFQRLLALLREDSREAGAREPR
ncbi:23S rRNA pseudouridine(1911/1915/1917) synthase RluD [Silanimonas lenta]|uniref:23S rRNA pseudouridine(1911/1915/1917) synthase RluD n=1 Tax=Silanimonas lenta TaxID=265429 RepID=UPI000418CC9C